MGFGKPVGFRFFPTIEEIFCWTNLTLQDISVQK
jgi:hypothetical protein